ncbi:MAG: TolC family protein [Planctomycetes bacterium]|nr:TolC family protein [Planctomycetota bacterium]
MVTAHPLAAFFVVAACLALRLDSDPACRPQAASSIGPDDCLASARERNPDCIVAREEVERARASLEEAEHKNYPHLVLNSRYVTGGGGLLDAQSGLGTFGSRFSSSLYLEQGFLRSWRDRTLSIEFAAQSVPEAQAMCAEVEHSALCDVLAAYVNAIEFEERAGDAEAMLASLRASEGPLRDAVDRGAALERDLVRLRESIAAAESTLDTARNDAAAARARLGRLAGIEIADPVRLRPVTAAAPDLSKEAIASAALASRADLARLRAQIATKEKDPALAGNALPDAALGLGYEGRGDSTPLQESGFGVRLRIDYPLGASHTDDARRARARAELRQLHVQESDLVQRIGDEVADAWRGVDAAKRTRSAAATALAAREEELRVLRARQSAPSPPSLLELADAAAKAEDARSRLRLAEFPTLRAILRLVQAAGLPPEQALRDEPAPKSSAGASPPRRAIWAWTSTFSGDGADPDPVRFLDFCVARNVGTVFLSLGADPARPELPFDLRTLVSQAASRGIDVEMLVGDPTHLDGKSRAIDAAVAAGARLAGEAVGIRALHLDVEPQAHDAWHSDRETVVQSLVACLRATREALARNAPTMRLVADLSPVFAERMLPEVDEAALMIYSSRVEQAILTATPILDAAQRAGKRVWIGVKASAAGDSTDGFQDLGALEDAIRRIEAKFRDHPAFRGVAIHHARSYRELLLDGRGHATPNGER